MPLVGPTLLRRGRRQTRARTIVFCRAAVVVVAVVAVVVAAAVVVVVVALWVVPARRKQ